METYIIVVDDDEEDIDILKTAFEHTGNKTPIKEYRDGNQLLSDFEKGMPLPCLIVVDLNMPTMRGVELIALLKANADLRHTPVIVFSTGATPKEAAILELLGIESFKKPSDTHEWKEVSEVMLRFCLLHVPGKY